MGRRGDRGKVMAEWLRDMVDEYPLPVLTLIQRHVDFISNLVVISHHDGVLPFDCSQQGLWTVLVLKALGEEAEHVAKERYPIESVVDHARAVYSLDVHV